jgi:hypothetical protein
MSKMVVAALFKIGKCGYASYEIIDTIKLKQR